MYEKRARATRQSVSIGHLDCPRSSSMSHLTPRARTSRNHVKSNRTIYVPVVPLRKSHGAYETRFRPRSRRTPNLSFPTLSLARTRPAVARYTPPPRTYRPHRGVQNSHRCVRDSQTCFQPWSSPLDARTASRWSRCASSRPCLRRAPLATPGEGRRCSPCLEP